MKCLLCDQNGKQLTFNVNGINYFACEDHKKEVSKIVAIKMKEREMERIENIIEYKPRRFGE